MSALAPYLGRQRWYAGAGEPDPASLKLVTWDTLATSGDGRDLVWAIVEAAGVRYQLLLGSDPLPGADERSGAEPSAGGGRPDLPPIPEAAVVGAVGERRLYDAVYDPALMLIFYELLVGSPAYEVRAIGVEQSNTSLVYDEAVILKLFRRLADGISPETELTGALAAAGFEHVAEPVATWRREGVDLAFAQRFLVGGSEGWALALASVRGLIGSAPEGAGSEGAAALRAAGAPGDFSGDAAELGRMTAGLHLALAGTFGADSETWVGRWREFVDDLETRVMATPTAPAGEEGAGEDQRAAAFAHLRAVRAPGPAVRLHGDYHLGQVMRSDGCWYVLDFEGEPTRSLEERTRRQPAAKDVGGMLRSIDYAARYALVGDTPPHKDDTTFQKTTRPKTTLQTEARAAEKEALAAAWERLNRDAFLDGYLGTSGVEAVMAAPDAAPAVFGAFELDKALYELAYEEAYRPAWVGIPKAAVGRILERLAG